jgi:hypothetical protein
MPNTESDNARRIAGSSHLRSAEATTVTNQAIDPQNPANICRGTEESLSYPYSMQIFIAGEGQEAVPVGPP